MYYSWLKKHNHLFKDINLNPTLIDNFMTESHANQFEEEITEEPNDIQEYTEVDTEFETNYFNQEPFNPVTSNKETTAHEKTTMFLNKYCENTDVPSIANRLAGAIVDLRLAEKFPSKTKMTLK